MLTNTAYAYNMQCKTYMEFSEQGSIGDGGTVLLDGLPELLLS